MGAFYYRKHRVNAFVDTRFLYKLGVFYSFEMISFMIHYYMKQIFKKE